MKPILSTIQKFFLIGDNMPVPRHPVSTMWIVWAVGVILIFDIIFAEDIFSYNSRTAIFIVAGIVPSILSFHNKEYVELKLKKSCKNLFACLYGINFFMMAFSVAIKVVSYWGEIGILFLMQQSIFLSFWLLSIPLVLIYNPWRWGGLAITLFLGTVGYKLFLNWHFKSWHTISFSSLLLTIGIVLIAAVVSCRISRRRIKRLFG